MLRTWDFLTRKLIHYKVESIQVERSEEGLNYRDSERKEGLGRFLKKLNIKDISEHEGLDVDNKVVYSFNTEEFKEFIKKPSLKMEDLIFVRKYSISKTMEW